MEIFRSSCLHAIKINYPFGRDITKEQAPECPPTRDFSLVAIAPNLKHIALECDSPHAAQSGSIGSTNLYERLIQVKQ
jgi:hypothetical protein